MPQLLSSLAPKDVNITVPDAYLEAKMPGTVNYRPSEGIFESECRFYGFNWVLVWCISCVLTKNFRDDECWAQKNYFELKSGEVFFKSRTWNEGVRAGVQFLAAHAEHPRIKQLKDDEIVFPGTIAAREKPAGVKTTSDLDKVYGAGFGAQVDAVYDELVAFALNDGFDKDPVIGPPQIPPSIPPKSLPPESSQEEPAKPPSKPSSWKITLAKYLGVAGGLFFIAKFFLPNAAVEVIKVILELLKKLTES